MNEHAFALHVDLFAMDEQRSRDNNHGMEAATGQQQRAMASLEDKDVSLLGVLVVERGDTTIFTRAILESKRSGWLGKSSIDLNVLVQSGRNGVGLFSGS